MTSSLNATLPSPQDLPHADVVIFDGECQFCRGQADRLHRWDGGDRLAFLSLHDPSVKQYLDVPHDELMERMYVVDQQKRARGGAEAVRYLSRRLPRLWPLAPWLHIPFSLPVWQWLYSQVARQRYRWNQAPCDTGKCDVHSR